SVEVAAHPWLAPGQRLCPSLRAPDPQLLALGRWRPLLGLTLSGRPCRAPRPGTGQDRLRLASDGSVHHHRYPTREEVAAHPWLAPVQRLCPCLRPSDPQRLPPGRGRLLLGQCLSRPSPSPR